MWLLSLIPSGAVLYAVLAGALLAALIYSHHSGWVAGETEYAKKQQIAQEKHDEKVKKDYAKIDKATPFNADKLTAGKWLLRHTHGQ